MPLTRIAKVMFFFTLLGLVYINLQMKIITLAYEGRKRENVIRRLHEINGAVNYRILKMKSSQHLGERLLNEDSDIGFVDSDRVVTMQSTETAKAENAPVVTQDFRKSKSLISFLSLDTLADLSLRR